MRVFGMITTKASSQYTLHALDTFAKHTPLREFDSFILIDNDGSFVELPESFGTFGKKIVNSQPKSFAQNVNDVMATAMANRADLFFLNNDLIFTPHWIEPLLIPEVSILSPFSNREIQYDQEGFTWSNALSLDDYLGKEAQFEKLAKDHFVNTRGYETVISLPFFCIKIPYLVYSELGPLDERFGKGGAEDNDYCLRAGLSDIPVRYAAQSYILHFSGKSTWSGAENAEEAKKRREIFSSEFEKKWGSPLTRLLIDEDKNVLEEFKESQQLLSKGDLKGFIEQLR